MAERAVRELKQIPFGFLIGAPLKAAVDAQAQAARTTVEFIQQVGFKPANPDEDPFFAPNGDARAAPSFGEARTVTFRYAKADAEGVDRQAVLTVPVLSIVPIPYLRIEEVTIDFTAKLSDTIETSVKSGLKADATASFKYGPFMSPVKLDVRASVAYESAKQSSERYTRDYTMAIHVRAVQDDIPAGLSRLLDLLEQSIREKVEVAAPAGAPV